MDIKKIKTLGALKKSGYISRSIKEELRENLISKLERREKVFEGIYGFDETVLPDIERAILSRHNILLLGLRGQAKTRIARLLTTLLDEYMPIVAGSEINDDPLQPLSNFAVTTISDLGDKTPIDWVHRDTRYVEKLATPDVSIADLIGDIDPIKAATLKLAYSDERVLHFGLIPRAHRSIFVINELPDLQARIQVSLFNILQEGDLQIRGFKLRLPLDIQFMFTANPEDYTNRGSIITPLKDRIESQILTHYPTEIEIATAITKQEANIHQEQKGRVTVPEVLHELLESVSFQARESEFVDEKSGVSARLSISGLENLVSNAERRAIKNKEKKTTVRITDFWGVVPAITGKLELVYEGEQVGPYQVAMNIIGAAIKEMFLDTFPHPDDHTRKQEKDPYGTIKAWFQAGNKVDLLNDDTDKNYKKKLDAISGLKIIVSNAGIPDSQIYTFMELMLHGLSELEVITKLYLENTSSFSDPFAGMFDNLN
ncbi:magnesium chelatase [Saprospiraceae bacterium]|jgi:magnesium chelatase subunit I|nr:magnesium chelatase [Saprospiraceae bacterium]MDC1306246.1 magnesium chelatase [Saprospiraceae bacterium]